MLTMTSRICRTTQAINLIREGSAAYPESAAKVPADLRIPCWSWDGLQR
jgi:hypothetical protein